MIGLQDEMSEGISPSACFPLHLASHNGNVALITKLIQEGHEVDAKDDKGWTAIEIAACARQLGAFQALKSKGAIVTARASALAQDPEP